MSEKWRHARVDTGALPLVDLREVEGRLIQSRTASLFWFAVGCIVCGVVVGFVPFLGLHLRFGLVVFFIGGGIINLLALPIVDQLVTRCEVDRNAGAIEITNGGISTRVELSQVRQLEIVSRTLSHRTEYQLNCVFQTDKDELSDEVIYATDNKRRLERMAKRYAEFMQRPLVNGCDS